MNVFNSDITDAEFIEKIRREWAESIRLLEDCFLSPTFEDIKCDCGGEKAQTGHAHWCSTIGKYNL